MDPIFHISNLTCIVYVCARHVWSSFMTICETYCAPGGINARRESLQCIWQKVGQRRKFSGDLLGFEPDHTQRWRVNVFHHFDGDVRHFLLEIGHQFVEFLHLLVDNLRTNKFQLEFPCFNNLISFHLRHNYQTISFGNQFQNGLSFFQACPNQSHDGLGSGMFASGFEPCDGVDSRNILNNQSLHQHSLNFGTSSQHLENFRESFVGQKFIGNLIGSGRKRQTIDYLIPSWIKRKFHELSNTVRTPWMTPGRVPSHSTMCWKASSFINSLTTSAMICSRFKLDIFALESSEIISPAKDGRNPAIFWSASATSFSK